MNLVRPTLLVLDMFLEGPGIRIEPEPRVKEVGIPDEVGLTEMEVDGRMCFGAR